MTDADLRWWQTGILYQVYPRSFQDSDGDGIGDLNGIRIRLGYLKELGINALWLSPIFPSPMADFGYDISDYTGIDPVFGSLEDFDALVSEAHQSGLKVILDLVPNHTSDQHPWFLESRSSRDNPKRDWYLWRDPNPDGGAPNNWLSEFGGSAWQFDESTGQYYYHAFLREQPDLNWRNPQLREAVYEAMRFWLRRGVDGFRVDVIWHLIKDADFRDNPPNPDVRTDRPPHEALLAAHTTDQPETQDVVAEMRAVVDEFDQRVLIGEIYLPFERLVAYYGKDLRGAHLPFNFALLSAPWHAQSIRSLIGEYEKALPPGAWPNWVLGNHDRPRVASRVGLAQARVAAMLLLTLRGTPTLYYGDEIAMEQVAIAPDQVRDPFEKNVPGIGVGRDGCRTPMQWDDTANAGFTIGAPWLPLASDYRISNVAAEDQQKTSTLNFMRMLIRLRQNSPVLQRGTYRPRPAAGDVLVYEREWQGQTLLIALNFSGVAAMAPMSGEQGTILLSTKLDRRGDRIVRRIDLRANEGLVIALD